MIAKVYRFNPEVDKEAHYDTFEVEVKPEDHMTIMNLLQHIAENMDSSLSFLYAQCMWSGYLRKMRGQSKRKS